jgi:hypothetical protein
MRRSLCLVLAGLCIVALSTASKSIASQSEKTLILRVRTPYFAKPATFSGTIQFDASKQPLQLSHQTTPYGIKMTASTLKASLQKESGDPDLLVELIEFNEEREVGSITKTGKSLEVDAQQSGVRASLSIR